MPAFNTGTHDDLIDVNITLGTPTLGRDGFSRVLYIGDDLHGTSGDRVAAYSNLQEVSAALTAGDLDATAVAFATAMFSQNRPPSQILIGKRVSASETWVQALDAVLAVRTDFYGVCIESRTDSDIATLAADIETKGGSDTLLLLFGLSSSADWLTSGKPSAYSAVASNERLAIVYHDDTSEPAEAAWAANRLAYNPDEQSVGWNCPVQGIGAYTTALTQTQKAYARENNANIGMPFGTTAPFFIDPGKAIGGRPLDHRLAADWLTVRLKERMADRIALFAGRGQKITVDEAGQAVTQDVLESTFQQAIDAGHTVAGQYSITPEAISAADLTAQRHRFTVAAQLTTSLRQVVFNITLDTSAVLS